VSEPPPTTSAVPPGATPTVTVDDEQDVVAIDASCWADLAAAVLRACGVHGAVELGLRFVDEAEMADLNVEHMAGTGPTDVLAFPLDLIDGPGDTDTQGERTGPDDVAASPGTAPLLAGDIVICPAVARRNAPDHAGTLDHELALLVVHGVLHLLGHDHAEPDERDRMQAAERSLLVDLHGPPGRDPWATDPDAAGLPSADPPDRRGDPPDRQGDPLAGGDPT
jgi:probable rRNA maturation factor